MDSLAILLGSVAAVSSMVAFVLETCGLRRYLQERRKQKASKRSLDAYWAWFEENGGPFIRL